MAPAAASTVAQYLASLPSDRRAALTRVRAAVNARLPAGYEETLQYGMISWVVPAARLSHTYNGQALALASLASQKQYMALYLPCVYADPALTAWFQTAYRATGKKLDMGKSCVRFQTIEQLPLDVVGEAIARTPVDAYVASYEANRAKSVKPKPVAPTSNPRSSEKPSKPRSSAKPASKPRSSAKPASKPRSPAKPASKPAKRG